MKKQANKLNLKFTYLLRDKNKCYLPFFIRRLSSLRAQISYQANRCTPPFLTVKNTDLCSSAVRSDMLWPRRHENNPRFKKLVPIFESRFKSTAKRRLWWTTQRATRLETCKFNYFCKNTWIIFTAARFEIIVGETQNQTVIVLRNASLHYRAVKKPVVFFRLPSMFFAYINEQNINKYSRS